MEKQIFEPAMVSTIRLVKSEDLNHHGTLFAGRTSEWFVEAGFIAAATLIHPKSIVCLQLHGLCFSKPVRPGQLLKFEAKIIYAGKSSLVSYIAVSTKEGEAPYVSGFITFINVNENTQACPHNIEIQPKTDIDIDLYEKAKLLKKGC